jgi:hypothetical protein
MQHLGSPTSSSEAGQKGARSVSRQNIPLALQQKLHLDVRLMTELFDSAAAAAVVAAASPQVHQCDRRKLDTRMKMTLVYVIGCSVVRDREEDAQGELWVTAGSATAVFQSHTTEPASRGVTLFAGRGGVGIVQRIENYLG